MRTVFLKSNIPFDSLGRKIRDRYHILLELLHLEESGYVTFSTSIMCLELKQKPTTAGGRGKSFVVWIVFATCYSIYAGAWVRIFVLSFDIAFVL